MFLDKISKELEEKERLTKKKQKTEEDYLKEGLDSDAYSSDEMKICKKKEVKKIYPVCISYHEKS